MFSRVNWGSITAGAMIGTGISFLFSVILRAVDGLPPASAEGPIPIPLTTWHATAAVLSIGISFAVAGASTVILGRFQFRSQALLHSLSAFLVAAVAIHYVTRGSLFIGYPGPPLFFDGAAFAPGLNGAANLTSGYTGPQSNFVPRSPIVFWTIAFSCIAGATTTVISGLRAFRWLEANKIWGERERLDQVKKVA